MSTTVRPPAPDRALALLGGLTPREFMRRHWQRKPLLVRNAIPRLAPPTSRRDLFALATRDDVESRLVRVRNEREWSLTQGPIARSSFPPLRQRGWTLLVQGVDLHRDAAHSLLQQFRFVPDARLDDLMISWASDGGGVGPHVDSYDVFLLQARGKRRWRIARRYDAALDERAPLKMLRRFAAEEEYVLEPGDLLYLPPSWAHEGVAVGGDCMTCSIGMRAPRRGALAGELAQRLAETCDDPALYRDARQPPTAAPAEIPAALARFAADAVQRLAARPTAVGRALGEVLSEPKPARLVHEELGTCGGPAPSHSTDARVCFTTHGTSSSMAKPCPSAVTMQPCCANLPTSDRWMRAPCAAPARPQERYSRSGSPRVGCTWTRPPRRGRLSRQDPARGRLGEQALELRNCASRPAFLGRGPQFSTKYPPSRPAVCGSGLLSPKRRPGCSTAPSCKSPLWYKLGVSIQQGCSRRAHVVRWLAVAAGLVAFDAAASSLRFFGTQLNDIDRVKIRVDDPSTSAELPRPIDVGDTDFTIELWLKTAAGNDAAAITCGNNHDWVNANIVIDRGRYSQGREWGIVLANGRIVFGVSNDNRAQEATICGTSDLRDGQWHHVAIQRQRSNGALWVFVDGTLERSQGSGPTGDVSYPDNGVPVSAPDCGGLCTNSDPFFVIGAEKHSISNANAYFGWVDELRVSTVLRYAGAFTPSSQAFTVDGGTAALYHFDEGVGASTFDATFNVNQTGEVRFDGGQTRPQWSTDTPFTGIPSPGTLQFSSPTYSRNETGGGTATISVSRVGGSSGAATVSYSTPLTGTATAGADYVTAMGTLTWANGDATAKTFTVTVNDDATDESDETVALSLTTATGAALGTPSSATLTIVDDDTTPLPGALSFSAGALTRTENQTTATLTVNRTGGTDGAVGVSYTTIAGTATPGGDYTTTANTLTWADGVSAARTITVPLLPDTDDEPDEQFTVVLSVPTGGATLGTSTVTVTITDDDAAPTPGTLQFSSPTYSRNETGGGTATITVSRVGGSSGAATVAYSTQNGTATAGADYVTAVGTLSWTNGDAAAKTFTVTVNDDATDENDETVALSLTNATGAALGTPSTATLTIVDDDAAPVPGTLRFSSPTYSRNEAGGGTATITVSRVSGSSGAATVAYSTQNGTATAGADYVTAVGTLTWANGDAAAKTFTVTVNDDATDESDETVALSLTNATGAALGAPSSATLTIVDDDVAPLPGSLSFGGAAISVPENAPSVTLTVNRTGGTSAVGVTYTTTAGSAAAGTDYRTTSGTLSFAVGDSTKTITVPLVNDGTNEPNEQFTVTLSMPTGGAALGATRTVTITITDDDVPPAPGSLSFATSAVTVGENQASVTLTVNRTGGTSGTVGVTYATAAGSALAGSDYQTMNGPLSFAAGASTATIVVPLVDDGTNEPTEQFTVTLSAPTGGAALAAPTTMTVTVTDDDPAPPPPVNPPPTSPPAAANPPADDGSGGAGAVGVWWCLGLAGLVVLRRRRTGHGQQPVELRYARAAVRAGPQRLADLLDRHEPVAANRPLRTRVGCARTAKRSISRPLAAAVRRAAFVGPHCRRPGN